MKHSSLLRKTPLARTSSLVTRSKPFARVSSLARTALRRKPRRPKPGDEPRYKAWIKTQPCVVHGWKCDCVDGHHLINGKGDARKGMGQTAPDKYLIPMCRDAHEDFHARRGFCAGWTDEQRLTFQEKEVERLRSIWAGIEDHGTAQEPMRLAI